MNMHNDGKIDATAVSVGGGYEGTVYSNSGTWRVTNDGQLCLKFESWSYGKENCSFIELLQGGRYRYESTKSLFELSHAR
jgi:hypothetical protein